MISSGLLILGLLLLLVCSAFFSSSETALFSLSPSKRNTFRHSKSKGKKVAAMLLEKPRSLLVTLLILNITVNLGVQNVISSIVGTTSSVFFTVIIPFVLTLVFGEILPKTIAVTKDEMIASKVSRILQFFGWLITPIRIVLLKVTKMGSFVAAFFLKKDSEITKEEIKHALISFKETDLMTKDEIKLLLGSLRLSEVQVKEVKCQRQNIYFHDISSSPQKLRNLFCQKKLSKIPIVDRDIDHVIGVVNAMDFFSNNHKIHDAKDIYEIMEKPFFAPESMLARTLLAHFEDKKREIALLVDEYGGVSGLITREDLVEIVVGQINDIREEKTLFTRQGEDVIICSGKYELTDLEALFDIEIKKLGEETTVGGHLLEILGDIPKSGYKVVHQGLLFHVLLATETKVSRVYIKHLKKGSSDG